MPYLFVETENETLHKRKLVNGVAQDVYVNAGEDLTVNLRQNGLFNDEDQDQFDYKIGEREQAVTAPLEAGNIDLYWEVFRDNTLFDPKDISDADPTFRDYIDVVNQNKANGFTINYDTLTRLQINDYPQYYSLLIPCPNNKVLSFDYRDVTNLVIIDGNTNELRRINMGSALIGGDYITSAHVGLDNIALLVTSYCYFYFDTNTETIIGDIVLPLNADGMDSNVGMNIMTSCVLMNGNIFLVCQDLRSMIDGFPIISFYEFDITTKVLRFISSSIYNIGRNPYTYEIRYTCFQHPKGNVIFYNRTIYDTNDSNPDSQKLNAVYILDPINNTMDIRYFPGWSAKADSIYFNTVGSPTVLPNGNIYIPRESAKYNFVLDYDIKTIHAIEFNLNVNTGFPITQNRYTCAYRDSKLLLDGRIVTANTHLVNHLTNQQGNGCIHFIDPTISVTPAFLYNNLPDCHGIVCLPNGKLVLAGEHVYSQDIYIIEASDLNYGDLPSSECFCTSWMNISNWYTWI